MNPRTKFLTGFFGAVFAASAIMMASIFFIKEAPALRSVPLFSLMALFAFLFWWYRRFRGLLPKPTKRQLSAAARTAKRRGFMYVIAPVIAYIVDGKELIRLPHGLGFLLPIFPAAFAVHYLRLSARLSQLKGSDETQA
jgi:uncharacterized iron-regulated membrane protein